MKPIFKNSLLALAGITASSTAAIAADDFAAGDIGIAFYQTNSAGTVVQPNTYVVNLGQASLYRENTQSGVAVSTINTALANSNIGADLVTAFGADWANDGTVRWMVVGSVGSTDPTTHGDPARTNYISRSRPTLANGATGAGSTIPTISSTNRGALNNGIASFITGTNNGIGSVGTSIFISSDNLAAAILPTSNISTVDEFLPPTIATHFGQGVDPRQIFAAGQISGGAEVEGALDLYRVLHTTAGADLTAGASTGNATAGAGQFIGTLTLDSAGNLKIAAVGGAPNPDADTDGITDAWETTHFGNLTQTATGDFDNDGTSNLTEFRLGLNPVAGSSSFATVLGSNGTLTWPSAVGVSFTVQRSTTLLAGSWQNLADVTGTASTATYTDSAPPADKAFYRVMLKP